MPYTTVVVKPTDRWLVGLSTETKPTPEASLALHRLMESDTGNMFVWSGTQWLQTHYAGQEKTASNPYGATDFYMIGTAKITIPSLTRYTFSLATPAAGHIIFKSMNLQASAGESDVHLYEAVSITQGGTTIEPLNIDRDGGLAFQGVYKDGLTSFTGGTELFLGTLLGGSKNNFADGLRQINIRLKQNNLYVLEVHNLDNQDNDYVIEFLMGYTPS